MPELPEVETVRRRLEAGLKGATISGAALHRANLRFAFPPDLVATLKGQSIIAVHRRAKYLLVELSSRFTWLTHLGMTGTFGLERLLPTPPAPPLVAARRHEHVTLTLEHPLNGGVRLAYYDPRRFGFMDLIAPNGPCRHLDHLGPEPLGNRFSAPILATLLTGRRAPIKSLLLDQRLVAGLGNIYVCEALHDARIDPRTPGEMLVTPTPKNLSGATQTPLERLVAAIRLTLQRAIAAGGSSLNDFTDPDGQTGYFQHQFSVYGRTGQPCVRSGCTGRIERLVQAGRSTFWCPLCQKVPRP